MRLKTFSILPVFMALVFLGGACDEPSSITISQPREDPTDPDGSDMPDTPENPDPDNPDVCESDADCGDVQKCCDAACVDIGQNSAHCGVCGNGCGDNSVCREGVCLPVDEPEPCVRATCESKNVLCGATDDGCGNLMDCGTCSDDTAFCQNGQCVKKDTCTPKTCGSAEITCGAMDDGCGAIIECGSCSGDLECRDGRCQATQCEPATCESAGFACGEQDDGCGKTLSCGACGANQTCAGGKCIDKACLPKTCLDSGQTCGMMNDGCGKTLSCGACGANQTCTGGKCVDVPVECTPKTCGSLGISCGSASDGCGKTLSCGTCNANQTCAGGKCEDKVSIKDTYPQRKSIKGLQPDFQNRSQVIGNQVHGVAMNLVWAAWQPSQKTSCSGNEVKYDGYCFQIDSNTVNAIKEYTANGVVVTAVIYGVPVWARRACKRLMSDGRYNVTDDTFCAPVDGKAGDYGRFAGFLANYFNGENGHGRIADFVIHNEVNSFQWFNIGCSNTSCPLSTWTKVYADSYNAAYDYIRKEQKQAKVLISFDHYFGKTAGESVSAASFLKSLVPKLGTREWMLAFHSYPPNLTNPAFGANDYSNNGIISFGNIGILAGWLRQNYPSDPHAWEIQLTENGINGTTAAMQTTQRTQLCQAFRNILGTPGITSFIYHRLVDHKVEVASGLGCGLWNSDGSAKPAWELFCYANRSDVGSGWPSCGFELGNGKYTKLQRGYGNGAHWVTSRQFPSGVKAERSWKLLRDAAPNTSMVYECRLGTTGHTFISKAVNCEGQFSMGPMGYIYDTQVSGTAPVYRCYNASSGDHMISPDPACEGYKTENLIGYAIPM